MPARVARRSSVAPRVRVAGARRGGDVTVVRRLLESSRDLHRTCVRAVAATLLVGLGAACRTARPEQTAPANCGADGLLRVRNFTGRVLEIFESRRGRTEFIGFASPGVTAIPVRGPGELDVMYRVREPSEGRDAATVTWVRPTAVARAPSRVALELLCR